MSEAEAIFEINRLESRLNLAHESKTFEALELALSAIRAQEQREPMTCEGCRHDGTVSAWCEGCTRNGYFGDNYEPKGAHQ